MKKKEFKKLIKFFDHHDQKTVDFSGFKNPEEAKSIYNELLVYRRKGSDSEPDFTPFFTDSVMGKISRYSHSPGFEEYLSRLFSRVVSYGLTAVVVMLITLYVLHGQDGFSALFGNDPGNDINFISQLFYEF
jgi:hypothetical protein